MARAHSKAYLQAKGAKGDLGPGRPSTMNSGRKVGVYLPAHVITRILELGGGNMSLGIRIAVDLTLR